MLIELKMYAEELYLFTKCNLNIYLYLKDLLINTSYSKFSRQDNHKFADSKFSNDRTAMPELS